MDMNMNGGIVKHALIALLLVACTGDLKTSTIESAVCDPDLDVDTLDVHETATIGSDTAAMSAPALELQTSTEGAGPLRFMGLVPNTWDLSPIPNETNGEARITFFGNTPSVYPNLNYGGFEVRVRAGTLGEGGISLKPNGGSYFDPDHYAQRAKILALGHFRPKTSLDIRDLGNVHDSDGIDPASTFDVEGPTYELDGDHRVVGLINALGNSTINTGDVHDADYVGANLVAGGHRGTGTKLLHNVALKLSASSGDTNTAIQQDRGDNYFNSAGAGGDGGNSYFGASVSVVGKMTVAGSGTTFATATGGLYNLLIGSEADGAYFVNSNLSSHWGVAGPEHIDIGMVGYHGGVGYDRDVRLGDGDGHVVMQTVASTLTTKAYGPIEAMGPPGVAPTWTSGIGTPEGFVTAPPGSLFSRTDPLVGPRLYVKETGFSATGWVGK